MKNKKAVEVTTINTDDAITESVDRSAESSSSHSASIVKLAKNPGIILQKAREKSSLSQREIADKLHITVSQIKALEENRYNYFHAEIFCKGYLRSYGKLLGVDCDALLEGYTQMCSSVVEPVVPLVKNTRHVASIGKGRQIQYWSVAIVVAMVILMWLFNGSSKQQPAPSLLHDEKLLTVDEHDRSLLEVLEKQAEVDQKLKTQVLTDSIKPVSASSDAAKVSLTDIAVDGVSSEQSTIAPLVSGSDVLTFSFSSDCWVKVSDSNDRVLVAGLKKAQQQLELRGRAPFRIVLGYAAAVSLQYNGEQVIINSASGSDTAKLVVGKRQ